MNFYTKPLSSIRGSERKPQKSPMATKLERLLSFFILEIVF